MLTALNYCTADFPRQGELRLQLQKMQSCSIFLTILHQAMQRKMSTKPHFWTYLSQIPFLYLSKPLFVPHWPNLVTWMHRRLKHIGGSDLRFWLRSLTHYCATNTSQHFSSYTRQCDEVTSRTRLGEYTRGGLAHISGTWSQFVIRGRLAQRELECPGSQRFQPQNDDVLWTRHHHYTMWSISIRTHNHYG